MNNKIGIEPILPREAWRFSPGGIDSLSRLFQQLSPYRQRSIGIDDLARLVEEGECLLAVDLGHNGHIVGIARLVVMRESAGRYGMIHDIVVDESHRGQGIGKALTLRAIEMARQLHLRCVELTSKPARTTANLMYQSLGFQLISAADPTDVESTNRYRFDL